MAEPVEKPCSECGKPNGQNYYYGRCRECERECEDAARALREKTAFEKATKIAEKDYDGPVYDPVIDEYFLNIDALREHYADDDGARLPGYVQACDVREFAIYAEDVIEHAGERLEWDEFAPSDVKDFDGLEAFLEEWNAKQSISSWHADASRIVLIDVVPTV